MLGGKGGELCFYLLQGQEYGVGILAGSQYGSQCRQTVFYIYVFFAHQPEGIAVDDLPVYGEHGGCEARGVSFTIDALDAGGHGKAARTAQRMTEHLLHTLRFLVGACEDSGSGVLEKHPGNYRPLQPQGQRDVAQMPGHHRVVWGEDHGNPHGKGPSHDLKRIQVCK